MPDHDWHHLFTEIAKSYQLEAFRVLSTGSNGRWAAEARGTLSPEDIAHLRTQYPMDVNCLSAEGRQKQLLIADMDSTVIRQESLDHLAYIAGKGDEIAAITAAAMAGDLDFEQALDKRLSMLAGESAQLLEQVIAETTITDGAAELVGTMRANGAKCYLVSGGFTFLTGPISKTLGFHGHFANKLLIEGDKLAGSVEKPILDRDAKLVRLNALTSEFGLTTQDAATIGDGANDLAMLKAAGLGVAFEGKALLREQIDVQLNHTDLTGLLFLQGYHEEAFSRHAI